MSLPVFGFSQSSPELEETKHSFNLNGDSLTIFQEAEFHSVVDWYADSIYVSSVSNILEVDIFYKWEITTITGSSFPYTSFTKDTISVNELAIGAYSLIVRSHELEEAIDSATYRYYTFYELRDSDTSHFQVLSDNSISFTKTPISFYPNPAKEKLTIEGLKPEDGEVEISIMDMNGKEIFQAQVSYQQTVLTLPDLPKGTYLLKTSTSSVFQKLLIE